MALSAVKTAVVSFYCQAVIVQRQGSAVAIVSFYSQAVTVSLYRQAAIVEQLGVVVARWIWRMTWRYLL